MIYRKTDPKHFAQEYWNRRDHIFGYTIAASQNHSTTVSMITWSNGRLSKTTKLRLKDKVLYASMAKASFRNLTIQDDR
jgi:hypothetical protein